jgi:hypothetical protein
MKTKGARMDFGENYFLLIKLVNYQPLLWSSGQSSWVQIQMSGIDSRRYQIYWGMR